MPQVFAQSGCLHVLSAALNNEVPALGRDLTLRLYTNDVTPAGDSEATDFTEATGSGYAAIPLTAGNWTAALVDGIPCAVFPAQTFVLTGVLTAQGWFITNAAGALVTAVRASAAVSAVAGNEIVVVPSIRISHGTPAAPVAPVSNVIGYDGVLAFQTMTTEQRASIWDLKAYFNHKSVGGNIVGDAADQGVQHYGPDFYNNYASTAAGASANTLCERIFDADNGQPLTKIAEWQTRVITHGIGAAMVASAPAGTHAVAAMKFCFTDKDSTNAANLGAMKTDYLAAVNAIKSAVPGLRIMHVGMPLGTAALWDLAVAHPLRIDLADWMKATFPGDVFFDLHDVERHHADGSTASAGGLPVLCDEYAADSSGHLNATGANWVAQAFLYAIYVAATRS